MTVAADDQRFATNSNHSYDPLRFLAASSPTFLQVGQSANVVHFTLCFATTELAGAGQQTLTQVGSVAARVLAGWHIVDRARVAGLDPFERNTAPVEGPFAIFGGNANLKSFVGLAFDYFGCPVLAIYLADGQLVFVRECFDEGGLHGVLEFAQVVPVFGKLVVFRNAAKPRLISVDDVSVGVS